MSVKWVIECDSCQAQEPMKWSMEMEADGGGMVQTTIMPDHWVTYRQNDRIKHFCGVECMSNHMDKLAIEEANEKDREPYTLGHFFQQVRETGERIRKAFADAWAGEGK